jgi:hypothetical protein
VNNSNHTGKNRKSGIFKITNNEKVFSYFNRTNPMKNKSIIGVVGVIIIIIAITSIVFTFNQKSDIIEVEDTLDKEIQPVESPEIQEKLDEIQKIANSSAYTPLGREWITSGPFQVDRSEYAIGESIFIRMGGIEVNEKGQIAIYRPLNATHHKIYLTIPFDGEDRSTSNTYFTPQINSKRGICSMDNLTGEWMMVFRGTDYPNLNFEINEKILPGTDVTTVC